MCLSASLLCHALSLSRPCCSRVRAVSPSVCLSACLSVLWCSSLPDSEFPAIQSKAEAIAKEKQPFERIVLSKEQALRMFSDNPFKVALITAKIPDGGYTTAYRCGPLIDLCRGPHVPTTAAIKSFEVLRTSAAYWLGNAANDSLQRVYGISFPDAKQLKAYKVRAVAQFYTPTWSHTHTYMHAQTCPHTPTSVALSMPMPMRVRCR